MAASRTRLTGPGPLPWATLAGVAISVPPLLAPALDALARYERAAILDGEIWRLVTGHFAHFGAAHWAWNVIVLAAAGVWLERRAPRRTRVFFVTAPLVISVALLALDPELATFAGLSGIGTGVVAMLAVVLWRGTKADRVCAAVLAVLLLAKLLVDAVQADAAFVRFAEDAVRNVPLAHAAGALWGVMCALGTKPGAAANSGGATAADAGP